MIGRSRDPGRRRTLQSSVTATLAPVAVGQLLAGLEGLAGMREYGSRGLLRGRSGRGVAGSRWSRLARALDSSGAAVLIHSLNIVGAGLVLTAPQGRVRQIGGVGAMFVASQLFQRRNPYGRDGSDQMSGIITGYRLVTALVPDEEDADRLFLDAVNAQAVVAYTASGAAKLISRSWMSGDALRDVLTTDIYGNTPVARWVVSHPAVGRLASRATIAWECAFPLVSVLPGTLVGPTLAAVKSFHIGVALTMGLPRFLWGFSGSHAAVVWSSDHEASS